jgi:hypothetical protein
MLIKLRIVEKSYAYEISRLFRKVMLIRFGRFLRKVMLIKFGRLLRTFSELFLFCRK